VTADGCITYKVDVCNDSNKPVIVGGFGWLQQTERLTGSSTARHDQYNYTHTVYNTLESPH